MVPFKPGEARSIRAEPGRRIKVAPGLEDALRLRVVEGGFDQRVDRFGSARSVILADPDQSADAAASMTPSA